MGGFVFKLISWSAVALFLTWCVSVAIKGMGPGAEVVFDALVGDPNDASDFDGFVRKGDGYDVEIRFRATDDWVAALPYRGFTKTECTTARTKIRFSIFRLAAYPPWYPEGIENAICFRRFGENEWSQNGRDYILADPEGGWVYFAGEGRERDRALPGEGEKYH